MSTQAKLFHRDRSDGGILSRIAEIPLEHVTGSRLVRRHGREPAVEQRPRVAQQARDIGHEALGIVVIGDAGIDQLDEVVGQLIGRGIADRVPADRGEGGGKAGSCTSAVAIAEVAVAEGDEADHGRTGM